jgi:hypothetical protein
MGRKVVSPTVAVVLISVISEMNVSSTDFARKYPVVLPLELFETVHRQFEHVFLRRQMTEAPIPNLETETQWEQTTTADYVVVPFAVPSHR